MHRRRRVVVVQRHRALGVGDQRGRPAGAAGEVLAQERDVAERGRHQQELGLRQLEQRHLPGPAAVGVAVEVELVHHHEADVGVGALAQRDVGQHLGGAGDDRRVGVDRGVAGEHADVGRAEDAAEGEELLADQRLDRRGVVAAPSGRQRRVLRAGGHQRLARAGRRRQDDVRAADQLDQRLLLRRVQHGAARLGPGGEGRRTARRGRRPSRAGRTGRRRRRARGERGAVDRSSRRGANSVPDGGALPRAARSRVVEPGSGCRGTDVVTPSSRVPTGNDPPGVGWTPRRCLSTAR